MFGGRLSSRGPVGPGISKGAHVLSLSLTVTTTNTQLSAGIGIQLKVSTKGNSMAESRADSWSNEQWASFIDAQSEQILSSHDNPSTPFSSIASASDPQLPLAIDHTLLKPEATPEQIDQLCDEALQYGFKASQMPSDEWRRIYQGRLR